MAAVLYGRVQARAIGFRSDGGDLEGELVVPERPRAALVLCHGIPSGDADEPGDTRYAGLAREMAARGYAAMWFDFRGSHGAPGDFSMGGWCRDLLGALDALARNGSVADLPRVVVGSSLGGAAAIATAAYRPDVAAVAALAAPAQVTFAGLLEDPRALLQRFRNAGIVRDPAFPPDLDAWAAEFAEAAAVRHVPRVAPRPLLLVHGDADAVVPYHHAERLFEAAREPKELVRIPAGEHRLRREPRALDALSDWLDRHLAART